MNKEQQNVYIRINFLSQFKPEYINTIELILINMIYPEGS